MKFEVDNIGLVNGDRVYAELQKWLAELDGGIIDSIIGETIDTVIDILIENMELA